MEQDQLVLGVDFGTDSVRTILVNARNGAMVASSVVAFPRWKQGLYCDATKFQFRQHPLDYIESLTESIRTCLENAGPVAAARVKALSIDTTGSTPVAVDKTGQPLALQERFADDPDAMFVLWKDHTASREATEINSLVSQFEPDYLRYVGGIYSSEWYWAKLLRTLRVNKAVRDACYSWVEHCDWMPFLLTGGTDLRLMKRSVCTAGHKALWSPDWNGLPPASFWQQLDPVLTEFTENLYTQVFHAGESAGQIAPEWATKLGLPKSVKIGIGAMDAHMAAVGGEIEPYHLCKVMGTSTCDMMVVPASKDPVMVKGICGVVEGSIIPGMTGLEAGQSAFGDVYAWFKELLLWPLHNTAQTVLTKDQLTLLADQLIPALSEAAEAIPLSENSPLSADWFNGRRTPDANPFVKAAITGLHLGTSAPAIFRSLAEATCFGSRAIIERFQRENIPVKGLTGVGGIAKKSPFIMQLMADITGLPLKVNRAEQTGALGAAMFAATVAGIYPDVSAAMKNMGQGFEMEYHPDKEKAAFYSKRYEQYKLVGQFIETSLNHYI
jgi:L-ribulokinase